MWLTRILPIFHNPTNSFFPLGIHQVLLPCDLLGFPQSPQLRWTWFGGSSLFITNEEVKISYHSPSETGNDSVTAIMFNLDSPYAVRPEVMQDTTWDRGLIPETLNSFIESLVQRVNRGGFIFELGNSSTGPRFPCTSPKL